MHVSCLLNHNSIVLGLCIVENTANYIVIITIIHSSQLATCQFYIV